ncbi:hypothetical protein BHM03_00033065 [Ensete ventricosum]|nr:hypothetical protein BHM03_00033065 [Ensete ventricosum]
MGHRPTTWWSVTSTNSTVTKKEASAESSPQRKQTKQRVINDARVVTAVVHLPLLPVRDHPGGVRHRAHQGAAPCHEVVHLPDPLLRFAFLFPPGGHRETSVVSFRQVRNFEVVDNLVYNRICNYICHLIPCGGLRHKLIGFLCRPLLDHASDGYSRRPPNRIVRPLVWVLLYHSARVPAFGPQTSLVSPHHNRQATRLTNKQANTFSAPSHDNYRQMQDGLANGGRAGRRSPGTLGRHLARRLVQVGVRDVFAVPGDFNLTLLDHLIAEPQLNLVGCCNELNAGYAADGYARATGVGACVVTFTVGGLSVINAIAGSYSENLPIICIVGGPNSNDYGTNRILHHTIGLPDFSQELRCFQTVTCHQVVLSSSSSDY